MPSGFLTGRQDGDLLLPFTFTADRYHSSSVLAQVFQGLSGTLTRELVQKNCGNKTVSETALAVDTEQWLPFGVQGWGEVTSTRWGAIVTTFHHHNIISTRMGRRSQVLANSALPPGWP